MYKEEINPASIMLDKEIMQAAQNHFDSLIKPVGSLGRLEQMVCLYAGAKKISDPEKLNYPKFALILLCPKEETAPCENAPIMVLASEAKATVDTIKLNSGEDAIEVGAKAAEKALNDGAELLTLTTMGKAFLPTDWEKIKTKSCEDILKALNNPIYTALVSGYLVAYKHRVPIMLDGLASLIGAYIAIKAVPEIREYFICSHLSLEKGSKEILDELKLAPVLKLHIADSNGYGAILAYGLFTAGLKAYKEMETFAKAGVHDEMEEFSQAKIEKIGKK